MLNAEGAMQVHCTLLQRLVQQHETRTAQLEAAVAAAQHELQQASAMHEALLLEYDDETAALQEGWSTRFTRVKPLQWLLSRDNSRHCKPLQWHG